jgi:DNA-binding XRE family transcriptional regulator
MHVAKRKPTAWERKLRRLRADLGLTQAEAAERAGVALRTWISWENGQRTPGRLTQRLLAQAFPGHFR